MGGDEPLPNVLEAYGLWESLRGPQEFLNDLTVDEIARGS